MLDGASGKASAIKWIDVHKLFPHNMTTTILGNKKMTGADFVFWLHADYSMSGCRRKIFLFKAIAIFDWMTRSLRAADRFPTINDVATRGS